VISDVRRTIFALRPLDWTTRGFLPSLRHFVFGFAEQVGWRVAFSMDEDDLVIPARLEPTIFRIVQESLNNVAKHAKATEIQVKLCHDEAGEKLMIDLRDNGAGFELKTSNHHGLGLRQMAARVKSVGGDFRVSSAPGQGTAIIANLPVTRGYHE
jgi:signal transduction histidine kinase